MIVIKKVKFFFNIIFGCVPFLGCSSIVISGSSGLNVVAVCTVSWCFGIGLLGVSSGGGFGTSNIVGTALWIREFLFAGFINWLSSKMVCTDIVKLVQVFCMYNFLGQFFICWLPTAYSFSLSFGNWKSETLELQWQLWQLIAAQRHPPFFWFLGFNFWWRCSLIYTER